MIASEPVVKPSQNLCRESNSVRSGRVPLIMKSTDTSRREVLRSAASLGLLAWGVGNGSSGNLLQAAEDECNVVAAPGLTEGPYFVDEILNRTDIRIDPTDGSQREGTQLDLTILLSRVDNCISTPLIGAVVDIWHCDAAGTYSDVAGTGAGKKFLRGYQMADRNGQVKFTTVFPGWYRGRAVHIHFKVRTFEKGVQNYEFTSQFFFDDDLINRVFSQGVYAPNGLPDTRNATDGIYNGAASLGSITTKAGTYLMVEVKESENLLSATANVVLDVAAGSTPDQGPGRRP
jgi:protocatechuate 3,4-dioxygenase beta subunit